MTKTYTVAGVSFYKGAWAVRYANGEGRAGVLVRNGHKKVKLYALPYAGAKEDAVHWLLDNEAKLGLEKAAFKAVVEEARGLGFVM